MPLLDVYNKSDQLTVDERRRLLEAEPGALAISALSGEGVDELIDVVASRLELDACRVTVRLNPTIQWIASGLLASTGMPG